MKDLEKTRTIKTWAATIGLAVLSAVGLALYSPYTPLAGVGLWVRGLLGLGAGFGLARAALPRVTRRRRRYALVGGLLGAASCVAGAELQVYGAFRMSTSAVFCGIICWLGLAALLTLALLACLSFGGCWLRRAQKSRVEKALAQGSLFRQSETLSGSRFFGFSLGIILLCWAPVWLAYAPGLANYDILSHLDQCVANQYSTLHPVCYTLFVKGCLLLGTWLGGGMTLALAFICWTQMLLLAGAMAYALHHLRKMQAPAWVCLLILAFFALFPVFPLMAISTTKDVPFAAFALLLMVQLLRLAREPLGFTQAPRFWRVCIGTGVFMGILRYNGLLSLGLWAVGAALFTRCKKNKAIKNFRLRALALAALVIGLALGVNQCLNTLTQAAPSFVTARDMASLPSQQMVRAMLSMEEGSEPFEDIAQWYSGRTMLQRYRPRLADYTKRYIDVDHDNGWRGFAQTWLSTGLRHPQAYLEAFLELNRGLWFVHDRSHGNIYPEGLPLFGYLLNNQVDLSAYGEAILFNSKLPGLQAFLNRLTTENAYEAIPGLRLLFSVGFQCWLSALLFWAACYRRHRALAWGMGWMLCLVLVLFAAPAVLVRYTLPVFMGNGVGLAMLARPFLKEE